MAKAKKNRKPPSRRRYEQEHPTISGRVPGETKEQLRRHLQDTGCSYGDFIKDSLGREESMVKKRVEMLASRQVDPSVEDRLRCVEDLVHQLILAEVVTSEYPPFCPHCHNQELFPCGGNETESTAAHPWIITWKCPKCGFFINTYKRINPKSIVWIRHEHSPKKW